jgi:hypothetical protein
MSYRMLLGFCICCFCIGFVHVGGGLYLAISGAGPASMPFSQVGLIWCALGLLSGWLFAIMKAQFAHVEKLELELRELRAVSQSSPASVAGAGL